MNHKHLKRIVPVVLGLMLTACAGKESVKVTALQKKDKNLSCSELMLEINEAEFYRKTAEKNRNPDVGAVLMPLGYISTYMDAKGAIDAADARIDYLNRVYDILQCDQQRAPQSRPAGYPPYDGGQPAYPAPMNYYTPQSYVPNNAPQPGANYAPVRYYGALETPLAYQANTQEPAYDPNAAFHYYW